MTLKKFTKHVSEKKENKNICIFIKCSNYCSLS